MNSIFYPLKALSGLLKEPITLPLEPREASDIYRGFHLNDWDICIGCGTCAEICDNRAIHMINIKDLASDPIKGIKPRRPAIDYGRCCWCALCIDICPTGSLSMSREYVHVSNNLNSFFILPDNEGMHGLNFPKGWAKDDKADLIDLKRQPTDILDIEARKNSFIEINLGLNDKQALLEASRCVQCGMCHDSCPTNMHAPEYIRAIWEGNLEEAVRQIYRTNPLPHVCGRVCTHRCETACSIGRRGEPIKICELKRYAVDNLPIEKIKEIAAENSIDNKNSKYKIAIIGSGPAGLTTAYDLARFGYKVTIFESFAQAGGMVRYGVPEYRLPYDKVRADIEVIQAMGVEIVCNVKIGDKITIEQLKHDFNATLIASGMHDGRSTRIPNSEHENVYAAIKILHKIRQNHKLVPLSKSIVVIGGGNVAFDVARSLARLQLQKYKKVNVTLIALESKDKMLADALEIKEGREESINIVNARGPKACIIDNNKLIGLETMACLSIFDENGRFNPNYDKNDVVLHKAEMIVEAVGQAPNLSFLGKELTEKLKWNQYGRLEVDENGHTSEKWLWAAGDIVEGPDIIHAIAAGHRVAKNIIKQFSS
jgi:glutamate synthase (NADPH/NADH) small chain